MQNDTCPQIADYGPGGAIGSWRELMSAAVVVRSTLGVSPSAYQDAWDALGPENAAAVMACILERAGHINSAGGYLRDLSRKAERSEFSLGPMLMALMRTNGRHAGGHRDQQKAHTLQTLKRAICSLVVSRVSPMMRSIHLFELIDGSGKKTEISQ